ncbi:MAG: hypothetical protein D6712_08245 [Chloroflexi bacterium]|nr:MAG: hypothetical protein D6712_08245 [Chloroflexota bacterium]
MHRYSPHDCDAGIKKACGVSTRFGQHFWRLSPLQREETSPFILTGGHAHGHSSGGKPITIHDDKTTFIAASSKKIAFFSVDVKQFLLEKPLQ